MFGVSKAVAHASVTAGDWIIPYFAATTISTFAGRVVALADGGSVSVATQSIASHICVLGRALEDGSTGTVISVFLNPQLYDKNLTA
jgi:enoyl reductase-like protein